MDVLAHPGHSRHEAADAADEQVDFHAGAAGAVERVDDGRLDQRIHLRRDRGRLSGGSIRRLAVDHLDRPRQVVDRGDDQAPPLQRAVLHLHQPLHIGHGEAGQEIHQLRRVVAEVGIAGEEVDVRVEPCRDGVVVAGGEVRVAPQPVAFAADDEADLAVCLDAHEAVDDLHSRFLEVPRPGDVLALVEAGLQLHDRRHLLAARRGLGEGLDDRGAAVGAVERLLDGHDVGIFGRHLHELHNRRERIVRPVQQHVAAADDGEDVLARGQLCRDAGIERLVLQFRRVDAVVDLQEIAEFERAGGEEDVVVVDLRRLDEEFQNGVGGARGDLDPYNLAAVAAAQLALHRLEQILHLLFLDGEVGIADDAERCGGAHAQAGEEAAGVRGDDVLDRHEARRVDGQEARHGVGNLQHHRVGIAAIGIEHQSEVQRQVRQEREGMAGVDGQRCEDRLEILHEVLFEHGPVLLAELRDLLDDDPFFLQGRQELIAEARLHPFEELEGAAADGIELLEVHLRASHVRRDQIADLTDPDHEELVEVVRADAEELHPFEQRNVGVLRFSENPLVEGEPAQLPIEQRKDCFRRRGRRFGSEDSHQPGGDAWNRRGPRSIRNGEEIVQSGWTGTGPGSLT